MYILHTFHSVPAYYTHSTTTVQERFILVLKRLYAIDTYKCHGCARALLQPWALSNKLCILSVVRVGHPLVICEVSSRSPQGAERREREKPCPLSIESIVEVTCWLRFLLNAYEERHKASYRGTAVKLYTYQDSSVATSHCQREKPKMIHTASNNMQVLCASHTS